MSWNSNHRLLLATGFLLALLVASIVLNYYLFNRGQGYYLELNATRLDPLGLDRYPTDQDQTALTDPDRTTVVFFGDSRAASWPSPTLDRFEFINRGIGSQTSAQVAQRFAYHVQPLRPRIVVVQVGINDLKTIPLFPDRREAIVADCKANLRQIVAQSTDMGALVILTTLFPLGEVPLERRPFWSDEVAIAVHEVNAYMRTLASEDVIIFDAYGVLVDDKGMMQAAYREGLLHINARGYQALNDALVPTLKTLN